MRTLATLSRSLARTLRSPKLGIRDLNRAFYALTQGNEYYRSGTDFINEGWDTLIILDACRYDLFRENNILNGNLSYKISRGSHTSQFLHGNFKNKILHDTVYTTATPQLTKHSDSVNVEFNEVYNIWNTDRWNEDANTVPPDQMTEASIESHRKHPNKRHIVHYIQPHYPFIRSDIDDESKHLLDTEQGNYGIWRRVFTGDVAVERDELWRAYKENFQVAIESVSRLIDNISGRIVVTSDHGNMIGERSFPVPIREWGHPSRLYTEMLVRVPWLTMSRGKRRDISSDSPSSEGEVEDSVVSQRLEDLGYMS